MSSIVLSLALVSFGAPISLHARAPADQPPPDSATASAPADAPDDAPDAASDPQQQLDAALESGDLTTAAETARAQREANPSIETWRTEGAVLEAMADWAGARAAYGAALELAEAAEEDEASAELVARRARVDEESRGTVVTEPESTHRERIDQERADRLAPPEPEVVFEPEPEPEPKDDRIIKKWYFWVTIASIAASGAAIAGLAIRNAVDENAGMTAGGGLDASLRRAGPRGPALLHF